jgi:membrane protease YdiL (CAAX protease family)
VSFPSGVPPAREDSRPVAGPWFTASLLAILAGFTVWGALHAARMRAVPNPNRLALYCLTLAFEWLLFGLVALAVRRNHFSLSALMGQRWHSGRELGRDIAVAAGFWVCALIVLGVCGSLLGVTRMMGGNVKFMLPQGPVELAVWVVLSISAGICEETVFRGFLQRQFTAWTKNLPAGILASAAVFGAGHMYQGWRSAILIGIYGVMFGVLAAWRRNLRPGMMAHAWQDSISGILGSLLRRSLG